MSFQRRKRGQPAVVYPEKEVVDNRGHSSYAPDLDNPINVTAAFIPQRSSRAEVPGQQQINVTRMLLDSELPNVGLWSRVEWNDKTWDVVSPPAYHHGATRDVRHWSIDLRERPD